MNGNDIFRQNVEDQRYAHEAAHALDRLIKYANGQNGSFGFDTDKRAKLKMFLGN